MSSNNGAVLTILPAAPVLTPVLSGRISALPLRNEIIWACDSPSVGCGAGTNLPPAAGLSAKKIQGSGVSMPMNEIAASGPFDGAVHLAMNAFTLAANAAFPVFRPGWTPSRPAVGAGDAALRSPRSWMISAMLGLIRLERRRPVK